MDELTIGDFEIARTVAEAVEILAVAVIATAVVWAIVGGLVSSLTNDATEAFGVFKKYMARGLLIALDLLIAADIIKTVTLESTLENVVILGLLVVIRTFLSWSLVLEVEGRWPWQRMAKTD